MSRVPNILLISHRFEPFDGQGRVNFEVARAALERGYKVTVLSTFCAEELRDHPNATHQRIGMEWLPTELAKNCAFASLSAAWVRRYRHQFDLVQGNGFITWEQCDVITAHFVHSSWSKDPSFPFAGKWTPYALYQRTFTALNARWEKKAFRQARRVIAVAKSVAQQIEGLGVPAERIRVILNGVDTEIFHPGNSERASFGLPEDRLLALFVGDIRTPRKNLDTVLRALKEVPDVFLVVAGQIEGSPYPALAKSLGVSDRVVLLGKISGIPALMRSVDLFVFPSRYEAHPLVVLEAMASALPMIVSGTFGAEDFLGNAGLILDDPNDENTLARNMKELLANPERLAIMAEAGREGAMRMRWSDMADSYLDVYESLMREKLAAPAL